jgi:hypothetical protein
MAAQSDRLLCRPLQEALDEIHRRQQHDSIVPASDDMNAMVVESDSGNAAPAAKGSSVDLEMSQGETVDLSEEERALFAEVTLRQWTNLSHRLPKFFKPKVTSAQVCGL